jgi:hypothetical protein
VSQGPTIRVTRSGATVSHSPDRERGALEEIERELAAHDPRLARRLGHPSRWTRRLWGPHRDLLVAAGLILVLVLVSVLMAHVR